MILSTSNEPTRASYAPIARRGRFTIAMFDGTTIKRAAVDVDAILNNDHLTFTALVDPQTGAMLNPIRTARDRGLRFRLVPLNNETGHRVEVTGSLHKFYNHGLHNADQYPVGSLLLTLDELTSDYGINLFDSVINGLEFGVNVELPFPVSQVLDNLIGYKNQSFSVDSQSRVPYYVWESQRYRVKLYDKGKQKGLDGHVMRFEIRVLKMQYFDDHAIKLRTLADLLNVANYKPLGALLLTTFNDMLFDDPAINPTVLTPKQRTLYEQGRNPRYWRTPDHLTPQQDVAHRKRLSRHKDQFRALLDQYGTDWRAQVSARIGQTWDQLTTVDDELRNRIEHYETKWQRAKPDEQGAGKCHKLTDFASPLPAGVAGEPCHKLTTPQNDQMSQINPLYSGVLCDTAKPDQPAPPGGIVCPVTGVPIDQPQPGQRFVSALMLRNNDDLMLTLDRQHRQYAKGSKEDEYTRAAHNVRNQDSNPRNNLRRRIDRSRQQAEGPQLSLFPATLKLSEHERALLDYWRGTPYEIRL